MLVDQPKSVVETTSAARCLLKVASSSYLSGFSKVSLGQKEYLKVSYCSMEYAVRLSPPPRGITSAYFVTPGSFAQDQREILSIRLMSCRLLLVNIDFYRIVPGESRTWSLNSVFVVGNSVNKKTGAAAADKQQADTTIESERASLWL